MKEYKVKRYGRDRRHQKTAATLKTVLMVLLSAGACAAGWFLYDPISAWLTEKAEERQQRQEQQRQEQQRQEEQRQEEARRKAAPAVASTTAKKSQPAGKGHTQKRSLWDVLFGAL